MRTMGWAEWAMLGLLSVLWGGSFFFIELAVPAFPPLTLVLLRVAGASAVLMIGLRVAGVARPRGGHVWLALAGMAVLNNVLPFVLFAWAQGRIAGGLASILNATTPIWAMLLAARFVPGERLTAARTVGALLGFSGVVVMMGLNAGRLGGSALVAEIACLAATLSYALAGLYGRGLSRLGLTPEAAAAGQVTAAAAMLLPVAIVAEAPWRLPTPGAVPVAAVAGLAVLSTALAYILYFRLLARAGPTNLLLVTFLIPVTAILLGWAVLGERLSAGQFAGMALIAVGLAAIDGRPARALVGKPAPPRADLYQGQDI